MNHIEALKICRDSLEILSEVPAPAVVRECLRALAATAVIEPVAASIESESFNTRLLCYRSAMTIGSADSDRSAIIRAVDAHCAAQVVQALAAKPAPTGWKLVPIEPTPEMFSYDAECTKQFGADAKRLMGYTYRFMLAAAPTPPSRSRE